MTKEEKIKHFISNNDIDLEGIGSELNSNITILAGYADYLGIEPDELLNILENNYSDARLNLEEIERVTIYACEKSYGKWWEKEIASKTYKFIER